eukprot:CAMPEP_0116958192 /NCGR_PEP_ID=MMETSP0467-20121206/44472_1 /TAXON_ID=283647 /ORGANISM="Mesodinium pulex, Strain SPMC105" /LENGTH=90 /DNA_ID=CAMNT_0004645189 /DNA_START=12 /DNA_END=280 /DNA_ORIENTATION=-
MSRPSTVCKLSCVALTGSQAKGGGRCGGGRASGSTPGPPPPPLAAAPPGITCVAWTWPGYVDKDAAAGATSRPCRDHLAAVGAARQGEGG